MSTQSVCASLPLAAEIMNVAVPPVSWPPPGPGEQIGVHVNSPLLVHAVNNNATST